MDVSAIISGVSAGVTVLVPLVGFAVRLERRLTRLETLVEAHQSPTFQPVRATPLKAVK